MRIRHVGLDGVVSSDGQLGWIQSVEGWRAPGNRREPRRCAAEFFLSGRAGGISEILPAAAAPRPFCDISTGKLIRFVGVSNQDFADYLRTYGQSGVVFGILVAHWTQSLGVNNQDSPPVYVQAPLFLNPVPPFLSLLHETEIRKYAFPVSSYLLFTAMGLLVEAFAIRRLRRSGEQV